MEKTLYKFHYSFCVSDYYKATNGLPISGYITAENVEQATKSVKEIAEKIRLGFNSMIGANMTIGEEILPCYLSQSVSIVALDVRLTEMVSSWGDCHDTALRNAINLLLAMPKYANDVKAIMSIYWERYKEELADYFCEECYWWKASEKNFDELCADKMYDEMCFEMFNHIFDDEDYRAILTYVRPKEIDY